MDCERLVPVNRMLPPGWPDEVPPADSPGWQEAAVSWLLDQCPAEFRGYPTFRRHPVVLAWIAGRHLDAQIAAMREVYRDLRVELTDLAAPEALAHIRSDLEVEGVRLVAVRRGVSLVFDALSGGRYVPRL